MDEKQFEAFLREFEARQPGPLPRLSPAAATWPRRILAAAVVILAATTSVWFATRRIRRNQPQARVVAPQSSVAVPAPPQRSLLQLTRLAQDDPRQFDATLDAASRTLLPGFTEKNSTLAVLAKE